MNVFADMTLSSATQGLLPSGCHLAAGVYNETAFRGLDYILYQASLNGIRVLFTLADNWKTQDSKVNVRPTSPRFLTQQLSRFLTE